MASLQAHAANASIPGNTGVSCFQHGCDYQDPADRGDADATTLGQAPIGNLGYVELRRFPTCQTNWDRVISTSGVSSSSHVLTSVIERQFDGAYETISSEGAFKAVDPSAHYVGGPDQPAVHGVTTWHTDMLYSPGPARATGVINAAHGIYSQY